MVRKQRTRRRAQVAFLCTDCLHAWSDVFPVAEPCNVLMPVAAALCTECGAVARSEVTNVMREVE